MSQISRRHNFNHLVVEDVLFWLDLLDWGFEVLDLIYRSQGTVIVVVILFLPELGIVLTVLISIIHVIHILLLVLVIVETLMFFACVFLDSFLCIFPDKLDERLEDFREDVENELWLFWILHETAETQDHSLSLMLFFVFGFISDKLFHEVFCDFLLFDKLECKSWVDPKQKALQLRVKYS